ncbi:MAG: hypothetical protein WC545_01600 [Patescibacteria group bacterium]|jgi:hypothetical protein
MPNFENPEVAKKGPAPERGNIQYTFRDGTIGFFKTQEELSDAIKEERENSERE